ncbi:hypothetical protein JD844_008321 [Phrynosoma platyrhinos]|uniref:Uncharacterized protein n=1 Tax=Phrynosoma platyrhinos TaxID=52577 RepID=A0ABQ7TE75_PHRPL|nr:hypothetical protein JD844_008321 [Phrynosoma platyrhinos]
MTFGTLRIKSQGLRAPHWHFNANEHGYLLKPQGGVNFIRTFQKQVEDQAINLPPNLAELVQNTDYKQSADNLVWRYFFDLKGSTEFRFPGGIIQWARYVKDGKGLKPNETIYSEFLHSSKTKEKGKNINNYFGVIGSLKTDCF